jgi:mono/diheme cytochrome c family protein
VRGALLAVLLLATQDSPSPDFRRDARPFLEAHCLKCHGPQKPKGGLDLSAFGDEASVFAKRKSWEDLVRRVRDGEMPPEDRPQPKAVEKERLLAWFAAASARHDASAPRDPGRAGFRRLNRVEYGYTVRDLLGVDLDPADDFPADDSAHGFDTIADVLSIPPLLVEKYFLAAERILDQLLLPEPESRKLEGTGDADLDFPASGRYLVRLRASRAAREGAPPRIALSLGGKTVAEIEVKDLPARSYEAPFHTARGRKHVALAVPEGVTLASLEVAGPVSVPGAKEARNRLFFARPGPELPKREAARKVLERFASRAWRRPVRTGEVERLLGLFDAADRRGDAFEKALRLPLSAVLCSPRFVFRIEEDRPSKSPWPVPDVELASRLSYFLWSSMPDERLSELAAKGSLREPAVLDAEIRRMLADPKSKALVDHFLDAWLQSEAFRYANPDNRVFPEFHKDWRIRRGMGDELRRFVEGIVKEDRSILEFIDADYTYVNEATAKFYGLPEVKGDQVRKVSLPDRRRGGLLGMGAILTMTSSPDRTSVVKRGKWILEKILGAPPPPPPPDAGDLKREDSKAAAPKTLRERMAAHRADPSCASCHSRIDPLGFGLESFDGVGRWREQEAGRPVDATGTLPGGKTFSGPIELKDLLLARKDEFAKMLAEKMMVYALGRGLEDADIQAVREVVEAAKKDGYRFSALAGAVARSYPFQHRRNATGDAR